MLEINKVHCWDCLKLMKQIPDKSIDLVLTDPPFWITSCDWDKIIPIDKMLDEIFRVIKYNWAVLLFCKWIFWSKLMLSAEKLYRYKLIWKKTMAVWFLSAKKRPLSASEEILVFYKKQPAYNPQFWFKKPYKRIRENWWKAEIYWSPERNRTSESRDWRRYPLDVIEYPNSNHWSLHPTQKPVWLMEYLIKTYSNEWDIVLDFTSGSGSTLVWCKNTWRNFIGIEKEQKYVDIANKRLSQTSVPLF